MAESITESAICLTARDTGRPRLKCLEVCFRLAYPGVLSYQGALVSNIPTPSYNITNSTYGEQGSNQFNMQRMHAPCNSCVL